jgi:hypothetical protein
MLTVLHRAQGARAHLQRRRTEIRAPLLLFPHIGIREPDVRGDDLQVPSPDDDDQS